MAFSYDEDNSNIENPDYLSAIRAALQDTTPTAPELSDGEIAAQYGSTDANDTQRVRNLSASLKCARLLARRYARQATFASPELSVQYGARAQAFEAVVADIADELQVARAEDGADTAGAGGILYAGRQTAFVDATGAALGAAGGGTLGGYLTH